MEGGHHERGMGREREEERDQRGRERRRFVTKAPRPAKPTIESSTNQEMLSSKRTGRLRNFKACHTGAQEIKRRRHGDECQPQKNNIYP